MSGSYEYIINLMCSNGAGSSTLEQHCSAMRMDRNWSFTTNQLSYAVHNAKADIKRLEQADPVADLDALIGELSELAELSRRPDLLADMDRYGVVALEWDDDYEWGLFR